MTKQQYILELLKKRLMGQNTPSIADIVLFGSQINGNSNQFSDYDVLIVPDQKLDWAQRREIADVCAEISVENDILIDYKIVSKEEIEHEPIGFHPLITDALRNGIHAR
jgi:predicted nucleotidyltransferase